MCRCIEYGQLALYAEGLLDADKIPQVERHVAGCPECARELARLEALGRLIRENRPAAAKEPAQVPQRAKDLVLSMIPVLRDRAPLDIMKTLGIGRRVRRIVGQLASPAPSRTPAFARGDTEQRSQLLYRADEYEITLSVRRMDQTDRWVIVGDVFGEEPDLEEVQPGPPVEVLLTDRVHVEQRAIAMEGGEFVLSGVKPGQYALFIHRGDKLLEIRDLQIQ